MDIVQAIKDEDMDTLVRNKDRLGQQIVPEVYPIHLALCQNNWPIIQLILTESCKQKGKDFSLLSKNSKIQKLQLERMSPAIRDLAWMVWSGKTDEKVRAIEQPSVGWFEATITKRFTRYKQEVASAIPKMNGGTIHNIDDEAVELNSNNPHIQKLFRKEQGRIAAFIKDRNDLWNRCTLKRDDGRLPRTTSGDQVPPPRQHQLLDKRANTAPEMTLSALVDPQKA